MASTLYIWFPGNAAQALGFYHDTFGGSLVLHSFKDMGRTDGPADAVAHGILDGPVGVYATDVAGEEEPVSMTGVSIAVLGAASAEVMRGWFATLAHGGQVLDPLQRRPWGAHDGQLIDRFGVRWLLGFEDDVTPTSTKGGS